MWGARKGTTSQVTAIFTFLLEPHSLSPPLLHLRHHPPRRKKRERPPWTTTTTPQTANPCVSSSRQNGTLKSREATDSQSHFPPPCRGRANARVGSVVRRRWPELSYPASRVDCRGFGWLRGSILSLPRSSRQVSRHPPTEPDQQQGKEQSIAATDRPRRPPPIGRAPGLDKQVEGAESLGRGNRAHVLFPLPSAASQSEAAPDRGTARNRHGFHGA